MSMESPKKSNKAKKESAPKKVRVAAPRKPKVIKTKEEQIAEARVEMNCRIEGLKSELNELCSDDLLARTITGFKHVPVLLKMAAEDAEEELNDLIEGLKELEQAALNGTTE